MIQACANCGEDDCDHMWFENIRSFVLDIQVEQSGEQRVGTSEFSKSVSAEHIQWESILIDFL